MANVDGPRTSTVLMYLGMGAFFAGMLIGSAVGRASHGGYGDAVVVLGILGLGAAAFLTLAIPAAVYSFVSARRDPGSDSHGSILARWSVLATAVIGIGLYANVLA